MFGNHGSLDRPRVIRRPPAAHRRLNVVIDHRLADAIEHQASTQRMTKSELVRRVLRQAIQWAPPARDPLDMLFGFANFEPEGPRR
jgi:hypothetical protein